MIRHPLRLLVALSIAFPLCLHFGSVVALWRAPELSSRLTYSLEGTATSLAGHGSYDGDLKETADGLSLDSGGSGTVELRIDKRPEQSAVLAIWQTIDCPVEVSTNGRDFTPVRYITNRSPAGVDLSELGRNLSSLTVRIHAHRGADAPPTMVLSQLEVRTFDRTAVLPPLPMMLMMALLPLLAFIVAESAGGASTIPLGSGLGALVILAVAALGAPSFLHADWAFHRWHVGPLQLVDGALLGAAFLLCLRRPAPASWRMLELLALGYIVGLALTLRWPELIRSAHLALDPDAETVFQTIQKLLHQPYDTSNREPLWVWMAKAFCVLFGEGELRLRYFSMTFSILLPIVSWRFVRDLTGKPALGLLVATVLALHGYLTESSIRGLRTEMYACLMVLLAYFVFVPAIPERRRLTGLSIALSLTALTALTSVSGNVILLAWAFRKHRLRPILAVVPLLVTSILVAPHLVNNYVHTGDAFHTTNMYGVWWRNYEFVAVKKTGCPGCPTYAEFLKDSMLGPPISAAGYVFRMHSLREIFTRTVQGYAIAFLQPGYVLECWVGTTIVVVRLVYYVGLVMLLLSRYRDTLLVMLLGLNLTAFLIPLGGFDPRLITHMVTIGAFATALPVWYIATVSRRVLEGTPIRSALSEQWSAIS